MGAINLRNAKPDHELTVDHCFAKTIGASTQLTLLNNASIDLRTDHKYTLHLLLDFGQDSVDLQGSHTLLRYRVGLLAQQKVRENVCSRFDTEVTKHSVLEKTDDPTRLHTTLVRILRGVCERALGRRSERPFSRRSSPPLSPHIQDAAVSVLLYKAAATDSKENSSIVPSTQARQRGIDALAEIVASLTQRYTGEEPAADENPRNTSPTLPETPTPLSLFSEDEVKREIADQDPNRACGSDSVHIRLLQALLPSPFLRILCHLYNLYLRTGTIPPAWNFTDIHLLTKDVDRPRDVHNLRPITLIGMHRKIFERLLLTHHFDHASWAKLHPTQAGFRGDYSTLTNAALLHHLMATRSVRYAAFIDLEKAFDVVDHSRLAALLLERGCPPSVFRIISSLTCEDVRSRVLVNGQASLPFIRTRGVLQGSPISPILFNIYIDDLSHRLNASSNPIPQGLLYADDGVLLANDLSNIQALTEILTQWSAGAKIKINVKKCGLLCNMRTHDPVDICINDTSIPVVTSYTYLGFPVKAGGIDFEEHLLRRLSQANGRAAFLRLHSDGWGPAHRLRVYRQFLAPMFEYGAPLVWAWAEQSPRNMSVFTEAVEGWKDLVS